MSLKLRKAATEQEELDRLFELKKKQDMDRTNDEILEMKQLNQKHAAFATLSAEEMEAARSPSKSLSIQGTDLALIMDDYHALYANKPGYPKPSMKNGMVMLTFKSDKEAADFVCDQALKGRKFKLFDEQLRLLAYSNGYGKLYHADGRQFKAGDVFQPLNNNLHDKYKQAILPPEAPENNKKVSPTPTPFK